MFLKSIICSSDFSNCPGSKPGFWREVAYIYIYVYTGNYETACLHRSEFLRLGQRNTVVQQQGAGKFCRVAKKGDHHGQRRVVPNLHRISGTRGQHYPPNDFVDRTDPEMEDFVPIASVCVGAVDRTDPQDGRLGTFFLAEAFCFFQYPSATGQKGGPRSVFVHSFSCTRKGNTFGTAGLYWGYGPFSTHQPRGFPMTLPQR